MANAAIETWLAPMGRNDVLVPYRISIPTKNGQMVVEASKLKLDGSGTDQAAR
jgi:hypothetical protein